MQTEDSGSKNLNATAFNRLPNPRQSSDVPLTLEEHRTLMSLGTGVPYVCEAGGDLAMLYVAPTVKAQFGFAPRDFIGDATNWTNNIHPDDRARVLSDLDDLFRHDSCRHEYRFRHNSGEYRWVLDEQKLLRDGAGNPLKIAGQWSDISARKQEAENAKILASRYHALADGAIEGIIIHRAFKPLFVNRALAGIFGYTVDEIMAMDNAIELIAPHDRRRAALYNDARAKGENPAFDYEQQGLRKDGSTIWLRNMARRIDWDGQAAIQSIMVDITKQKLLEIELRTNEGRLRENEARLRTILDNAPIAIYLKDNEGRYVFSNRQNADWYNVDPVQAIGRSTEDYFPPDHAKIAVARDRTVMETRETLVQETDLVTSDGTPQHCLIYRLPMVDGDGDVVGVLGMNLDITERKQAEIALREAEHRVRDFAEATSDWFWQTDAEHHITHLSSQADSWHDRIFAGRIGKSRFDFESFDGQPHKWRRHREDLAAHRPFRNFRYRYPTHDGSIMHTSVSGRPFFGPDGRFLGYRGTGMDVTAEVEARNQLLDAIDSMADGVIIFDAEERLVVHNQSYAEMYGGIAHLLKPGAQFEALVRAAAEHGMIADAIGREESWIVERTTAFRHGENLAEQQMKDGSWAQISERKTPNGYTVGIRTDITTLKRREAQLRQAQKMEIVGQLTGGVAHDFNNMLAAIVGNLELMQFDGADAAFDKECVELALRAAHRGAELTHHLLAFSRQQELNAKLTNVNELLPKFSQLAQRTIGADIAIETVLAARLWPTMVDAGQLENALLNLTINARDAMPKGGLLTIETANQVLQDADLAGAGELIPGAYVTISVSDNGTGMPAEVRERVFEPFFTTKDIGDGSGLGLSMVFGFAKQSGGHVSIDSEVGQGTTVRIYLPTAKESADETVAAEGAVMESGNDRPTGTETILVVEDEPAVRGYLVTVLGRLGYTVLEAEDGPSALEVMAAEKAIDLLLTDVILPRGMSGRDVAAAFRERFPGADVLYSSGYTGEILSRRGQLEEGVALLHKPYQTSALAQAVRGILDKQG